MTSGDAGKGDSIRPYDRAAYYVGYDRAFGKKQQPAQKKRPKKGKRNK
jgi:hypothetical protein